MILKLLLTILLLYYIGVLWKYYRSDLAGLLGKDGMEERGRGRKVASNGRAVHGYRKKHLPGRRIGRQCR